MSGPKRKKNDRSFRPVCEALKLRHFPAKSMESSWSPCFEKLRPESSDEEGIDDSLKPLGATFHSPYPRRQVLRPQRPKAKSERTPAKKENRAPKSVQAAKEVKAHKEEARDAVFSPKRVLNRTPPHQGKGPAAHTQPGQGPAARTQQADARDTLVRDVLEGAEVEFVYSHSSDHSQAPSEAPSSDGMITDASQSDADDVKEYEVPANVSYEFLVAENKSLHKRLKAGEKYQRTERAALEELIAKLKVENSFLRRSAAGSA